MPNLSKKQLIILGGLVFLGAVLAVLMLVNLRSRTNPQLATVKIWGLEPKSVFDKIINPYQQTHPNVTLEYKSVDPKYYEERILNALASGEGPDIFMVSNRNFESSLDKLIPCADSILVADSESEVFNLASLRSHFPSVVEQDFVKDGKIYALPLYIDTLAMFYNQDIFDRASIVTPPRTWEDLKKVVPYLRSLNQSNQIVQAAAAIGGSDKSVTYPANLVELLLIQNAESKSQDKDLDAFNFYLQFGNSGSTYYTWNESLGKDYEAFLANKVAMVFGYYSDKKELLRRSPYLNLRVAQIPQVDQTTKSIANYWGFAVSKQSKVPEEAWSFLVEVATSPQYAGEYMVASNLPPALKSLIEFNINDINMGIFARQALTARAYQISDGDAAARYLNVAIEKVLSGQTNSAEAFMEAKSKLDLIRTK
ncbi:MAG: extracellular solute-binding protein [Candidatus Liptonbacteria bacterium]